MARGSLTIYEKITEREKSKLEAEILDAFEKVTEYCSKCENVGTYSLTGLYTARQAPGELGLEIAQRLTIGQALAEIRGILRDGQLESRVEAAMDKLLDSFEKKAARS